MSLLKKVGLVLKETITSPSSSSYIIEKGSKTLILRSGGSYEGIDLSGVDLSASQLKGVNLRGANLSGANLSDADLTDADLRNANLSGTTISGTCFQSSNLDGANLVHITFTTPPSGVSHEIMSQIEEASTDE